MKKQTTLKIQNLKGETCLVTAVNDKIDLISGFPELDIKVGDDLKDLYISINVLKYKIVTMIEQSASGTGNVQMVQTIEGSNITQTIGDVTAGGIVQQVGQVFNFGRKP